MSTCYLPKKVVIADEPIAAIKEAVNAFAISHLFILYSKSAMTEQMAELMKESGATQITMFEMPKGEPTFAMLEDAVNTFQQNECDGIVAIGGGSTLDLAKAVAAIAKDSTQQFKQLATYLNVQRFPLIAVPTTAGTGSEATKVTVLTDESEQVKYNPGHPDLIPDVAVLSATLTTGVPKQITAQTGLDALTHAIEAYVSTKANELSDFFALKAIALIGESLQQAYEDGANVDARKQMLLGSFYAGVAFSNASTNLAHAMGRALGTKWNLPHGLSVALTHPFVIKFGYESVKERYDEIAHQLNLSSGVALPNYLLELNETLGIWKDAAHVAKADFEASIDEMTTNALAGNGILTNAQIPTASDIQQLYKEMFYEIQKVNSVQL